MSEATNPVFGISSLQAASRRILHSGKMTNTFRSAFLPIRGTDQSLIPMFYFALTPHDHSTRVGKVQPLANRWFWQCSNPIQEWTYQDEDYMAESRPDRCCLRARSWTLPPRARLHFSLLEIRLHNKYSRRRAFQFCLRDLIFVCCIETKTLACTHKHTPYTHAHARRQHWIDPSKKQRAHACTHERTACNSSYTPAVPSGCRKGALCAQVNLRPQVLWMSRHRLDFLWARTVSEELCPRAPNLISLEKKGFMDLVVSARELFSDLFRPSVSIFHVDAVADSFARCVLSFVAF